MVNDKPLVKALRIAYDTFVGRWAETRPRRDVAEAQQLLIDGSNHLKGILEDLGTETTRSLRSDLQDLECNMGNLGDYPIGEMVDNNKDFWERGARLFQEFEQLIEFIKER